LPKIASCGTALELGKHRAILLDVEKQTIRGDEAARARVVLDDDAGSAGNEAEVACHQTRRDVADAAGRVPTSMVTARPL
jgi:hypothetical protein